MAKNTKPVKKRKENEIIGPWTLAWRRFKKNKLAIFGAILFFILVITAVAAPLITPYHFEGDKMTYKGESIDFGTKLRNKYQPPSSEHWLGTNRAGDDVMSLVLYGGRISLTVGVVSVAISVTLGLIFGGVAGFYGGWVDNLIMRFAEIIYSFPFMPLLITLSAALQGKVDSSMKVYLTMVLIGVIGWPGLARMIRGQILALREMEFMEAATAMGISDFKKIFKYLIPNTLSLIIVYATLRMAGAILTESGLSFLGFGVIPPTPTWGNLIQAARSSYNMKMYPWLWVPPGTMIFLAVIGINLFGEGLKDAFDPKA